MSFLSVGWVSRLLSTMTYSVSRLCRLSSRRAMASCSWLMRLPYSVKAQAEKTSEIVPRRRSRSVLVNVFFIPEELDRDLRLVFLLFQEDVGAFGLGIEAGQPSGLVDG